MYTLHIYHGPDTGEPDIESYEDYFQAYAQCRDIVSTDDQAFIQLYEDSEEGPQLIEDF